MHISCFSYPPHVALWGHDMLFSCFSHSAHVAPWGYDMPFSCFSYPAHVASWGHDMLFSRFSYSVHVAPWGMTCTSLAFPTQRMSHFGGMTCSSLAFPTQRMSPPSRLHHSQNPSSKSLTFFQSCHGNLRPCKICLGIRQQIYPFSTITQFLQSFMHMFIHTKLVSR